MARVYMILLLLIPIVNTVTAQNKTLDLKSVKIGNQFWMSENIDVSTFRNGEAILHAQSDQEWEEAGFK